MLDLDVMISPRFYWLILTINLTDLAVMKSTDQDKEQENQKSNSSAQALIDATRISQGAHKVIAELHAAGFQAYLVGGGVRDL